MAFWPPWVQLAILVPLTVYMLYAWGRNRLGGNRQPAPQDSDDSQAFDYEQVDIPPLRGFDVANTNAGPYRPWKAGKFVMTMGIQRVAQEEWLGLDKRYWEEQRLRADLLSNHYDGVMQILPGAEAACEETLQMVVSYLTRRFPDLFFHPPGKPEYVHNRLTDKTFRIVEPFEAAPLAVAAQLVMEDLNLLVQGYGEDPEEHYLAASFSMAPAGWDLRERIGWPMYKLHHPVPFWQEKLRKSIQKAFLRMRPEDLIARHNFFMQTTDVLFQQEPFLAELAEPCKVEDVRIRHERQTLRRLPRTKAILFTVRTYMLPAVDLADEPDSIRELLGAIRAMPDEMGRYKTKQLWGEVLEAWCEEQLHRWDSEGRGRQSEV